MFWDIFMIILEDVQIILEQITRDGMYLSLRGEKICVFITGIQISMTLFLKAI